MVECRMREHVRRLADSGCGVQRQTGMIALPGPATSIHDRAAAEVRRQMFSTQWSHLQKSAR